MDTRERILESAQRLVRQRGFNGFSYAVVAEEVGIRKASLHHHFASKVDLGVALMAEYTETVGAELARISKSHARADAQLEAYVAMYRSSLEQQCMCLGGMLASDAMTLDPAIVPELRNFFAANTDWLTEVLAAGKSQGVLFLTKPAAQHARMFLSAVQGALLIARATGDGEAFDQATSLLIQGLSKKQ